MYFNKFKRRHFLQAVGGTMALPFLPSLAPPAHAAPSDRKCLITIAESHGGYNVEQMFPLRDPTGESVLYSGSASAGLDHRIRKEALSAFTNNTHSEFSPILGSFLNSYLDKINVLRGLDVMFYAGHHQGCYLGNFAARSEPAVPAQMTAMETIDQVIANSANFYGSPPTLPIINVSSNHSISYARVSGSIQSVNSQENWSLLNTIVGADNPIATTQEMTAYLNSIHSDYANLVNGSYGASRRLSAGDRLRLEEHVALIDELRSKIQAQGGITGACRSELVNVNTQNVYYWPPEITQSEKIARWQNTTDLIVGAIKCGATRIANLPLSVHPDFTGDWHQAIAHRQQGESDPEVLRLTMENFRFTAQHVFLPLIEKLNVDRGDGQTYLDNSLLQWVQESGFITHDPVEMPVITAGSAGGFFDTGNYVDYRNMSNLGVAHGEGRGSFRRPGLPYNRWLYTVLKAMDVPDEEFAQEGMIGYADPYVESQPSWFANMNGHTAWPARVVNDMGRLMPGVIA